MPDHVTLLRPPSQPESPRPSTALPADVLEQVRARVRILAALMVAAFGSDLAIAAGIAIRAWLTHTPLPPEASTTALFLSGNLLVVVASAGMWRAAGGRHLPASRLLGLGLIWEVGICATIAGVGIWQYYLDHGFLPNLTWVPVVVILFPLILPGPPRRILPGAVVAAATVPLAILILDAINQVTATGEDYVSATMASLFAVVFAVVGARVVYGLGREVAAARELGSYRLEERLGEGGMGEVWRARHRMLARPAAVKLIRTATSPSGSGPSSEATQRFEREAQAIASLRSPHTVEVFDFGLSDDGRFYYAMELLDGLDTDHLVRRFGPVPAERALYILRQVCHSLSEAHAAGLVHRDIKPANVFVCRYGQDWDFVKVLDFGIVKASDVSRDQGLTGDHAFQGTPAFTAPEQATGRADLDGRADLYAVGCLAYWLLTGEYVFAAPSPMDVLMAHVGTAPTPPSARSEMPIPQELDDLVLSCLAKDPDGRPPSARELVHRLDAVPVATAWTEARAERWWTTNLPSTGAR